MDPNPISLTPLDPQGLDVFRNERDILRDLFVYLDYVGEHRIKRMTSNNDLPRADYQRLTKLFGGFSINPGSDELEPQAWIDFIDVLAFRLGFVSYDTEGRFRGYTSESPYYPDNFMSVNDAKIGAFLERTPGDQERDLLEKLISGIFESIYDSEDMNEFYQTSLLGRLDPFTMWGMSTGVVSSIPFTQVRRFLLELLAKCEPGVWYSTRSLVDYLKANHPYFLIPKVIPPDRWKRKVGRYDNFHEGNTPWNARENSIPEDAPDAFERVEGRYVERFLENVPLLLRLVDVAYAETLPENLKPMRDYLQAFRVSERLRWLIAGNENPPRVIVQPNLDVVIQSDFYPAKIVRQMSALGEPVNNRISGEMYVGIYQLKKTCVAAERARHPDLDVVSLLRQLGGRDLPPNVRVEVEEWIGHADQFTLYEGFALLESAEELTSADPFTREQIAPTLRLVKDPNRVYSDLEQAGCVPLRIQHGEAIFAPLPEQADSVFPKQTASTGVDQAPVLVKAERSIAISIRFPDQGPYDAFQRALAELRCPFLPDNKNFTLTFDQKHQAKFAEAVERLADRFNLQFD